MPTLERKNKGVSNVKEQRESISHTNQKEPTTSRLSEQAKQRIAEANRQDRIRRGARIESAKQLGEALDAQLIAMTGLPPGIDADPAVYKSNQDASYFMIAGKRGEVSSIYDPEEVQKQAKRRVGLPLDFIGEYAIVRFDFKRRIEEGGLFYTPEGYIAHKPYDPKSDPPLVQNYGDTPSLAK
jgi:hypothetical protein